MLMRILLTALALCLAPLGASANTIDGVLGDVATAIVSPIIVDQSPQPEIIPVAGGMTHGTAGTQVNFLTGGFGATCNGVANDTPAFANFVTAHAGTAPVVLTMPASTCCISTGAPAYLFRGVRNLIVNGYGGSVSQNCPGSVGIFQLASKGIFPNTSASFSLSQSVSAGASCLTLVTVAEASRAVAGRYVAMTALDQYAQGPNFPTLAGAFEFLIIASSNPSTGQVCFTTNLVNSYLSTYPYYYCGSGCPLTGPEVTTGPATLMFFEAEWDGSLQINGLTIDQTTIQTYAVLRSVKFTDVTFTGTFCGTPTQTMDWTVDRVNGATCGMEVDKLIGTVTINASTWQTVTVQSAGTVKTIAYTGGTVISNRAGTPDNTICNNSTLADLRLGAQSYGRSLTFSGNACNFAALNVAAPLQNVTSYTLSSGTVVIPDSVLTAQPATTTWGWADPPSKPLFSGAIAYEGSFNITGPITQSGGNTRIGTDLPGSAFPTIPLQGGTTWYVRADPMPNWSCVNCTGSLIAVDLSNACAQGRPVFECTSRTFTCAANIANVPGSININSASMGQPWGAPLAGSTPTITFAVSVPDTSPTGTLVWHPFGQFGTQVVPIPASTTTGNYNPILNLKLSGTRTIASTGSAGGQSGDSLPSLSTVQNFGGPFNSFLATAVPNVAATCPVVTVTMQLSR